MKKVLITGSGGLVGSEAVKFFCELGFEVMGIDNDSRGYFFGKNGSTKQITEFLLGKYKGFSSFDFDIRENDNLKSLFKENKFDFIIHAASQPSHDWAAKEPITDFTINAVGTLYLLENFRLYNSQAVFIFVSTNKVYGARPNSLPFVELENRYEINPGHSLYDGINETMSIDNTLHSLMGASKTAADILTQEYGKYFNLQTGIFRAGCITGPAHRGTEEHGFLNYLVKCILNKKRYTIFGYKGKQVRDNIHVSDLINAFYYFYQSPHLGEVYNIGGGRYSNCSLLEAITMIENLLGHKAEYDYMDKPRLGDHIWYISDYSKFKDHYPKWEIKHDLKSIIDEIIQTQI